MPARAGPRAQQMHLEAIGVDHVRLDLAQPASQVARVSRSGRRCLSQPTKAAQAAAYRPAAPALAEKASLALSLPARARCAASGPSSPSTSQSSQAGSAARTLASSSRRLVSAPPNPAAGIQIDNSHARPRSASGRDAKCRASNGKMRSVNCTAVGQFAVRRRAAHGSDQPHQTDVGAPVPDQIRQQAQFRLKFLGPHIPVILIPIQEPGCVGWLSPS